jgi:hypothetical protein
MPIRSGLPSIVLTNALFEDGDYCTYERLGTTFSAVNKNLLYFSPIAADTFGSN